MWQNPRLNPNRVYGTFLFLMGCGSLATILGVLFFVLWLTK